MGKQQKIAAHRRHGNPEGDKLTPLEERFVEAFVSFTPGSAYRSALHAGCSSGTDGYGMLKRPQVQLAIDNRNIELTETGALTPIEIHQIIRRIATNENAEDKDILRAVEMAAKANGMFIKRSVNENHNYDHSEAIRKLDDKLSGLDDEQLARLWQFVSGEDDRVIDIE